jgi:hypothetical protein
MTTTLALLDDGSCSIRGECMDSPGDVVARCPQVLKCGTCVAWSPREGNSYKRNSGQCMLDRTARVFLDCNAQICPYYRPRQDSPAVHLWQQSTVVERRARVKSAGTKMNREAPPPSKEALARAAFRDQPHDVAEAGATVLAALLGGEPGAMPVLLERFRGGTVRLEGPGVPVPREAPLEAFYARIVLLRSAIAALAEAVEGSSLGADEKDKIGKDLASMGGSMTTFNLLFKDKEDQFKGQGGKS